MATSFDALQSVMHPGFLFFPACVPSVPEVPAGLEPIQMEERVLRAALGALHANVSANGVQRIANLALGSESLDFHLTFTLEAGTNKVKPDIHFAIRKDSVGHNQVLYWWYRLEAPAKTTAATQGLYFVWTGCAGQGDAAMLAKNRTPGVQYGTTAMDTLQRLLGALVGCSRAIEVNAKSAKRVLV